MNNTINDIIEALEGYYDEKRKEMGSRSHPTKLRIIGVTVPNVKAVLKIVYRENKDVAENKKLGFIKKLIATDIFECNQLALEYLGMEKQLLFRLKISDIRDLMLNLDNWVLVDTFSLYISGPLWREGNISTHEMKALLNEDNLWFNRVAVVSTVALNLKSRGGRGDIDRTIEICKLVVDDHRPMIYKALSWSLRELSKFDKQCVYDFVDLFSASMHRSVLKEVMTKLTTGKKNPDL